MHENESTEFDENIAKEFAYKDIMFTSTIVTNITYAVNGGNIYFDKSTGAITSCDTSVISAIIPDTINGVKVTFIGGRAFYNCSGLKEYSYS